MHEYPSENFLPEISEITAIDLIKQIKQKSTSVLVAKDALVYTWAGSPGIKLELARLSIGNQIYFSLCVEGYSETLVKKIIQRLQCGQNSCHYVDFLKKMTSHD